MPDSAENAVFSMPIYTPTYDMGWNGRLRLSALLRWQQEAGEQQLIRYHMPWNVLAREGFAFVLTRAAGVLHQLPTSGQHVRVETWQRTVMGASFYRGYFLVDEEGNRLAECASSFALVQVDTHRPLRPRALGDRALPSLERASACETPPRLHAPEQGWQEAGVWEVRRSCVDFNGHLNNAVYADLLMDFLPSSVAEKMPCAFALQFEHEARCGDRLRMCHLLEGSQAYVAGWKGDVRCFVGRAVFSPDGPEE